MGEHSAAGQAIIHDSARAHVAGTARYIDDIPETAGTLHAAPVLSPYAHAVLHGFDDDVLIRVQGRAEVRRVVFAADIPGSACFATPVGDEPILAADTLHYVGQVIALVVASSYQAARRAAHELQQALQCDVLAPVLDIQEAIDKQQWVLPPVRVERGLPDAAIKAAPNRLGGRFYLGGQEHFYLEGQVAYALPQEQGGWLVHSSTQHPGEAQHWIASALDVPANAIDVVCRRMGGGFGGKETQAGHLAVWATLASHLMGCPVKMRLDRDDDILITGKRHPMLFQYEVGFTDHGVITGLVLTAAANCGFSADLSGPVNDRTVFHVDNAYFLSDVRIDSLRCRLNTQSHTAFRGFGGPQGMVAIETIIEQIAHRLDMDALTVRRHNLYADAPRNTTHYGMAVEDNIVPSLFDALEQSSEYQQRRADIDAFNAQQQTLRKGIALTPVKFGISFTATQFNQAGARLNLYTDGTVQVNHGGTEMGQGLHTKVIQVVADELGVLPDAVRITASDTGRIPNASATAASSGTDLNGRAAQYAARELRDRLVSFIAAQEGVSDAQVSVTAGRVRCNGKDSSLASWIKRAYTARIQLFADGFYATPKIHYDKETLSGRPFYYFAYGAAVSEVVIDTLTGESRVLGVDILHDTGRSINPAIDLGQIEGGFIQGMGWLTTEALHWDEHGHLRTHAPSTYKIPAVHDLPPRWRVTAWDKPNREDNVFGSKAVGEPPLMLAVSVLQAIRYAVQAASASSDPVTLDAPASAENVLRALYPNRFAPAARDARP